MPSNVWRQEAVSLQLVEEYMATRYARMHGLQRGANHDWEATSICAIAFAPQAFSQVDAMFAVKVSRTILNRSGPEA